MSGNGRPPQLTPAIEHAIADLVAAGIPLVDASRALDLGPRTVYRWVAFGRAGNGRYGRFLASIEEAQTERQTTVEQLLEHARERILP